MLRELWLLWASPKVRREEGPFTLLLGFLDMTVVVAEMSGRRKVRFWGRGVKVAAPLQERRGEVRWWELGGP